MKERRQALGGLVPSRTVTAPSVKVELPAVFDEFLKGIGRQEGLDDDGVREDAGEAAARQGHRQARRADRARRGAHVRHGVALPRRSASTRASASSTSRSTSRTLLYYKEAKDGQILEEGITEAGSISSWIAAGTAYATHGVNTIPFFIYYSMFGFQRVGDFIWAAADARCRGFLLGGTAGRTTLAGEGLQHQDGNSHTHRADRADLPRLRSGVRLRAGGDHRGRHQADVRRRRGVLLLPHRHERAVRDAGDARRREGRHHQGALPVQRARPRPARPRRTRSSSAAARSSTRS